MKKVSVEGYALGTAYLDFFIKMIPSVFGLEQNYGTLAKWILNTNRYQTYGFSIWAEAFLNFGYFGIPFMFIIGKIFNKLMNVNNTKDVLQIIRVSLILYFFADIARRSISEFGYNFLFNIIMPITVVFLISKIFIKYERSTLKNEI